MGKTKKVDRRKSIRNLTKTVHKKNKKVQQKSNPKKQKRKRDSRPLFGHHML